MRKKTRSNPSRHTPPTDPTTGHSQEGSGVGEGEGDGDSGEGEGVGDSGTVDVNCTLFTDSPIIIVANKRWTPANVFGRSFFQCRICSRVPSTLNTNFADPFKT